MNGDILPIADEVTEWSGRETSMSDRVILHSDCNCFYALVELLHHPELRGKLLAVGAPRRQDMVSYLQQIM